MADKISLGHEDWIPGGPQTHFLRFQIRSAKGPTKAKELLQSPYSHSLTPIFMTLHCLKNRIDGMDHQSIWDEYKKITNPYEFVFLSLAKRMQFSVAKKIPLSRSYYKMIEIWNHLGLSKTIPADFITAHSAEGPGGFIEACVDIGRQIGKPLKYSLAMTLKSTDKNIPGWKKSQIFLQQNPAVEITYGTDDTGDLYNIENHRSFRKQLSAKAGDKADIYTADGGFDFTSDFNNQEENVLQLILAEILLGLTVLKRNGILIIKLFDTVLSPTIELLYVTTRQFREWTILKPKTSRAANSERYLVCRGFLGTDEETIYSLTKALHKAMSNSILGFLHPATYQEQEYIEFEKTIMMYQQVLSENQIKAIKRTLHVIENKTPEILREEIRENIQRSLEWCKQQGVEINDYYSKNSVTEVLEKLTDELISMNFGSAIVRSYPSRKYPREHFQLRRKLDAVTVHPLPSSQTAELCDQESSDHSPELIEWQTDEGTQSGNWETVKRQQRRNWKGVL